jgi:hypothetical protein
MATPVIAALPIAPTRGDGPDDYMVEADAFTAALTPFSIQVNTAVSWMADTMVATLDYKNAAASSASAAGGSATQAGLKVVAAAEQVALATTQAQNAATSASSAQAYAAAAGAASGAPSLVGNGKKVLTVKADETGVEWKATGQVVGDILFSATPPAANYIPAAGNIYSQSAYPGLFSKLSTAINLELSSGQVKVTPGNFTAWSIAYGAGKFVAGCGSSTPRIFYSSDGVTWSGAANATGGADYVAFANGRFFVFNGGSSAYQYSPDGINWTAATMPSTGNWHSVAYGNGVYVAIGQNAIAYSSNGVNWTGVGAPVNANYYQVIFAFGMFIAVSAASVAQYITSTDGITWTARSLPYFAKGGFSMAYANGVMVVLGNAQTSNGASLAVIRTVDGVNWTIVNLPEMAIWSAICYAGGKFVVMSSDAATLAVSVDGLAWGESSSTAVTASGIVCMAASPTVLLMVNISAVLYYHPIYSYDPATQFATPVAQPPVGTKAYIKYQE